MKVLQSETCVMGITIPPLYGCFKDQMHINAGHTTEAKEMEVTTMKMTRLGRGVA